MGSGKSHYEIIGGSNMAKKSVVTEAQEIQLAIELINLGARLQLLESETSLSRERLLKLFAAVGLEDPWVSAQRRRLSAVLFG